MNGMEESEAAGWASRLRAPDSGDSGFHRRACGFHSARGSKGEMSQYEAHLRLMMIER